MDLAKILYIDGGLPRTLHLGLWWYRPRGAARGAKNVVFLGQQPLSFISFVSISSTCT